MSRKLLEQIARARRFAVAMNSEADRARFEKMAADYQSELDAAEAAEGQSSATPTSSQDAAPNEDAVAAQPQTQRHGWNGADVRFDGQPEAGDGLTRRPFT